ncbi:type II secretion system F family protein [Jatrophihabitans sp.]|uniref:type II secretion system F family protein n=1 Tax=Jatrophihabitans sp. TaxID=1932789 RepID=UPI0030C6F913|nr:hypothetical protein [Jatrophihabitans sp.]
MSAVSWLLLTAALVVAPRASPSPPAAGRTAPGAALSPRLLDATAAVAATLGCLAVAGLRVGLVAAGVVAPAVVIGVRRLRLRAQPQEASRSLPVVLVLVAASLRAGAPPGTALELAVPAADEQTRPHLLRVVGLLRLGASSRQAWAGQADDLQWRTVAAVAQRSGESGIRLAEAFERLAAQLQQQLRARAAARARRAGVLAVGPLGLCFLPAFVCLGIVPVIIAVAGGIGRQVGG